MALTSKDDMNTDRIFDKICTFDNLYEAYINARKGKRYRKDVLEFSANLEENLIELQNDLIWGTYEVGRYREFYVREPKKRLIMALQFKDRVVQWAIYRQINPILDKKFIDDSYACRVGKGTLKAMNRLQYWVRKVDRSQRDWYYLKLDISKYFYRVNHKVLLRILGRSFPDDDFMALMSTIVNCEHTPFGLPAGMNPDDVPKEMRLIDVGMPIGNLTSQMLANLCLNELDQYAKHTLKRRHYIRYMDDIIILGKDKKELGVIKEEVERFLNEELKLSLNNKTRINKVKNGIDFVGSVVYPSHAKVKKQTALRIKRSVKYITKAYYSGELPREKYEASMASYKGFLERFDCDGLKAKIEKMNELNNM